ncbi:MAG: hypothetical protein ABSE64_12450 [Vulcanimicrobiaceae bacterium]|jgi:hypothetical protein
MKKSGSVNRGTALKISGAAMAAVVAEIVANQLPAEGGNIPINMYCESLAGIRRKVKGDCKLSFTKVQIFIWAEDQTPYPQPPAMGTTSIIFDNREAPGVGGGGILKGFYAKDGAREGESSPTSHSRLSIVVVAA